MSSEHRRELVRGVAAFTVVALLAVTGCSSDAKDKQSTETPVAKKSDSPITTSSSKATTVPGVAGGLFVETHSVIANVTAVDAASRVVTVDSADTKGIRIKCGPEIRNFDQIKAGDKLKVVIAEELAIAMEADSPRTADGAEVLVMAAQPGQKPAGITATTVQVTATVTAIDVPNHKATLEWPNGEKKTIAVRPDVDLTRRHVGEKVFIRKTEVMALSVEKQ